MADSPVLLLHNSLRRTKERWAIFFGAGASYDFGIPTMDEIANILRKMIETKTIDHGISDQTCNLLANLCTGEQCHNTWNIEDLLTRLHELLSANTSSHSGFATVKTVVGETPIDTQTIKVASEELINFMAIMCDLASAKHTNHGNGKADYLSDFLLSMASFVTPQNNLIRLFSINIDLCVEAAMVKLSQRSRLHRRPDFVLIDGFENSLLPTFNMSCYTRTPSFFANRCAVYYWKLHGSVDWTYAQPLTNKTGDNDDGFSDQSIIVRRVDRKLWDDLAECGAIRAEPPDSSGLHQKSREESKRIVIFPTPAKYSLTYTFPYMDLFEAFRRTLEEVELLICVGTSFPDQHIRSAIRSFVERDNTLLFVIDPNITNDKLKLYLGPSSSIQPVINMGFQEFIQEFKMIEAASGGPPSAEANS